MASASVAAVCRLAAGGPRGGRRRLFTDPRPVEDVIARSAYGIQQDVNGRYLYGEYYQDPEGGIDQYVNVIEDRTTAPVSDGQEVGVVTAYCEDADGNEEDTCPDWVNQTV